MRTQNITASSGYHQLIFRLVIGLALLLTVGVPFANGQQTSTRSSTPVNLTSELLFKSPARLLYAGDNVVPTGKLNVKTYRLEEVKLPHPLELSIRGTSKSIDSVIRLIVTGEKFPPGEYTIWVGEEGLADVMRSSSEITTVIFDRSLLQNGATISISYATLGDPSRTVLPEALYVPAEAGTQNIDNETTVTRVVKVNRQGEKPFVEIELTSEGGFQVRNAQQVFQIGNFETSGSNPPDGNGYKWIIRMPLDIFENLEDGTPIFLKTERGKRGMNGRIIVRLNKQLLQNQPDR